MRGVIEAQHICSVAPRVETFLGGAAPTPDPPRFLPNYDFPGKFRFSKNAFFSNFELWEIVFMGFLTRRNLPEMLGGHMQKMFFFMFCLFLHAKFFHCFQIFGFAITAIIASPGSKSL